MIDKIKLIKQCFPDSWIRKCIFLIYPTKIIKKNNKLVAMLITKDREIILLGVDKNHRRRGLASKLINESGVNVVYARKNNISAIKFYQKNGFKLIGEKKTFFGTKVRLEK